MKLDITIGIVTFIRKLHNDRKNKEYNLTKR